MEVTIAPKVKCVTRRTRVKGATIPPALWDACDTRELPAVLAFNGVRERWSRRLALQGEAFELWCELEVFDELENAGWLIDVPETEEVGAILFAPSFLTGPDYELAMVVDPGFLQR